MCGIYVSEHFDEEIIQLVKKRGRDYHGLIKYDDLTICSSVLYIRDEIKQPICTDKYIFLYNGEIYNESKSDTFFIKSVIDENIDTIKKENIENIKFFLQIIYEKINKYENELSLVIILKNFILFFKDDVGRKSLGFLKKQFGISSVKYDYEINSNFLYIYNKIDKNIITFEKVNYFTERFACIGHFTNNYIKQLLSINNKNIDIEILKNNFYPIKTSNKNSILELDELLKLSVFKRIPNDELVIFFSGGIDSIILAMYLHFVSDISRPIYLINTGFNNSQDRINGKLAYKELSLKFKNRKWIFIENNLNIESIKNTKEKIYDLIYPKSNNMDFNIGTVLYFTAKTARSYSKVGFLGSGADELFCGYNKYKSEKPSKKMLFDIITISYHNLTRDDRVISNNNFESRLPFLDKKIINFALNLKRDDLQNEIENKIILRKILRYYNLNNLSNIPKKAMQYGSGIFKLEKCIF